MIVYNAMKYFFIPFLLLALLSPAAAQPDLGFRGLRIGMTHTEFWSSMDFGMWEYDELVRPDIQRPATMYILSPEPLQTDLHGGSISLGCLNTDTTEICIWIHHAVVGFDASRMNTLTVATTRYNIQSLLEIRAAVSLLLDSLTRQFGKPHIREYAIDTASIGYIKGLPEDTPPALALWEWKKGATTHRAQLYLQPDGEENCTVWLSMWDAPNPVKRKSRSR